MNTRTRFQKEAKGNSEMAYLKKQIYMCMRQSGSNVKYYKLFVVGAYLSMKQGLILFQLLEGSDKEKMAHRSTQVLYPFWLTLAQWLFYAVLILLFVSCFNTLYRPFFLTLIDIFRHLRKVFRCSHPITNCGTPLEWWPPLKVIRELKYELAVYKVNLDDCEKNFGNHHALTPSRGIQICSYPLT